MNSCEKNGHIFGTLDLCVFCRAERPPKSWRCSECGEECTEECPHTCYANYEYLRLRVRELTDELAGVRHINRLQAEALADQRDVNRKLQGGWDAFYKLRKAVGEERYPGMTGEVTTSTSGAKE